MSVSIFRFLFFLPLMFAVSYAGLSVANPGPDVTTIGMSAIPNMVFNADHGINQKIAVGGALSLFNKRGGMFSSGRTELFKEDESTYFEGHINYVFREYSQDLPLDIAFTGGLWGTESKLSLELGVLLDVPISKKFNARFNLIYGPRAGIELAYKVQKKLDFCFDLGFATGIIGARYYL